MFGQSDFSLYLCGATVKANSYNVTNGNVTIANGKTYYDGEGNIYYADDLDAGQISDIAGKTLRTYDYRTVEYVAADGTTATADARPLKTDNNMIGQALNLPGGWYVVEDWNPDNGENGGVDFYHEGNIHFQSDAHLILCDGAEMSVSNYDTNILVKSEGALTIYGQSDGNGKLSVVSTYDINDTNPVKAIYTPKDFIINGGNISASGETTGIGTLDTRTGVVTFGDEWYSLDGRKLDGKPTKKGLYINKGNKVVIK